MSSIVETLPAHWYHSDEIFEREKKLIFSRHWSYVGWTGHLAQAGQYLTTDIAGQSVVVVNAGNGRLRGFLNLCRHRASPVCLENRGQVNRFTCPYHSWTYDLDGALVSAPGFGEELDTAGNGLLPVRVDIWRGLVFACLDESVDDLDNWMGDINAIADDYPDLAELEYETMRSNPCAANWKNYSDNSAEGYHLGTIHPGLSASLVRSQTRIAAYENGRFVGFNVSYREDDGESPGFWIYKFPGLLMHYSMNSFNIEKVTPVDARSSRMERWFWFRPEVDMASRAQTIEFSNQVMEEDMGICARVQRNLESGNYDTGYLSREREPGTVYFQSCVREALQ